jgi:hypothetical protein
MLAAVAQGFLGIKQQPQFVRGGGTNFFGCVFDNMADFIYVDHGQIEKSSFFGR